MAMGKPARNITPGSATGAAYYELPLSERMRTFLRLEFLYQQMLYNCEDESGWATRATITSLLEIIAILSRGDVRGDVHKELDHQIGLMQRFQSQPGVDTATLDTLMRNLIESRDEVAAIGTHFLQPIKDSEFLRAIQHRNSIPGGTCEFDLPEYNHWLRQPYSRRSQDLALWIGAINGMYQHSMRKDANCRLLRVVLPDGSSLFPEISGSQHRFTVRFLEWSSIDSRAVQTGRDVPFQLAIC
jgi:cell division protein ZapD